MMGLMLDLNPLHIPEEHVDQVPCQIAPTLFTTPDLDVDVDEPEFLQLSYEEQKNRLILRDAAEQRAVTACLHCPILQKCREWALQTSVFGVAGGMTQRQRATETGEEWLSYAPALERGSRGKIREDLVRHWVEQGIPANQIAEYLQANIRTVERYKAKLNESNTGRTERKKATRKINLDRISQETLAMYQSLADGGMRSRDSVIEAGVPYVSKQQALQTAKNLKGTESYRVKAGKRKFLMNRLDIAIRRGRIHKTVENGTVLLWLDENVETAVNAGMELAVGTKTT